MKENFIGVICSKTKEEIYCIKGSKEYKEKYENSQERYDIIYIEDCYLSNLISEWDFKTLLKYEIKDLKDLKPQQYQNPLLSANS